ncbi:MAG: hypothetical protein K2H64_06530, partial [Desulfovibrio sp.]|nr:hypothetical protein [Desulfovibrio sp.]
TEDNNDKEGIKSFLTNMKNIGVRVVLTSPDFNRAQESKISERTKQAARYLFSEAKKMNCFNWCGPFFDPLFETYAKEVFAKDAKA